MAKSNVRTVKRDLRLSNRRGGFYWIEGVPHISVTQVLRVISKPSLRFWFGKEVYLAMVKDPTLDQRAALAAPYQTSTKAKDRGSTVHSIVEAYKKTGEVIDTVPEQFQGYVKAFYSWVNDNDVEILEQERTVYNKEHGYAGTLDMLAKLNKHPVPWILDVKTGKDIYPEAGLQLSAYKHALTKAKLNKMGVILLQESGKYKFQEMEDEFEAFLHAKALWTWQNQELYMKMMKGNK